MHTNYVISLSTATQRREHITQEFGRQQIPFEFFDAVTPTTNLDELIQKYLLNLADANLSPGEKACFMSHYVLWQKCLDEDLPYIYVFEDDVLLGENAYDFLAEDKWLEERFDINDKFILRFETFLKPAKCENVKIAPYKNREIFKLLEEQYGLAAYVISQQAIRELFKLISNLSSQRLDAIDILAFRDFLNKNNIFSYQLSPAISVQELQWKKNKSFLSSQLEEERYKLQKLSKVKPKRSLTQILLHIITKPKRLIAKRKRLNLIIFFK